MAQLCNYECVFISASLCTFECFLNFEERISFIFRLQVELIRKNNTNGPENQLVSYLAFVSNIGPLANVIFAYLSVLFTQSWPIFGSRSGRNKQHRFQNTSTFIQQSFALGNRSLIILNCAKYVLQSCSLLPFAGVLKRVLDRHFKYPSHPH